MIYGYCRISKRTQNIERQVRNIRAEYPYAHIVKEAFTGTRLQGRKALDNLLKSIEPGDTIVFDSASRMSRNEEEAVSLYEDLFSRGVNLVFLKEHHIDTEVYRKARDNQIEITTQTGNNATDNFISSIIDALNDYTIDLAKEQIRLVFAQAEKEVKDLHDRTAEGMLTAKLKGRRVGQRKGAKLTTRKSIEAKKVIQKYSRQFSGTLDDAAVCKLADISKNTLYKYKKELMYSFMEDDTLFGGATPPEDIIEEHKLNGDAYMKYRTWRMSEIKNGHR